MKNCPQSDTDYNTEKSQHDILPIYIGADFRIIKAQHFQCRKLPPPFCDINVVQIVQNDKCQQPGGNESEPQ